MKLLLKGAIKKFVVDPALSATVNMLPDSSIIQTSLLDKNLSFSTSHLIKFGLEKVFESYIDEKLRFTIEHLRNQIYQVIPANDLAARFFKEYTDEKQLLVDLSFLAQYIDKVTNMQLSYIDNIDKDIVSQNDVFLQALFDIDIAINRAGSYQLSSPQVEKDLVNAILQKNVKLIDTTLEKLENRTNKPNSANEAIIKDFPEPPYSPKSDERLIDEMLERIGSDIVKTDESRKKVEKI